MSDPSLPEPLEQFLSQPPVRTPAAELRRDLLRQTMRLVQHRRVVRRRAAIVAAAAAVVLFVVGVWLALRDPGAHKPVDPVAVEKPSPDQDKPPQPAPKADHQPEAPSSPRELPAVALEWKAFDAPREQRPILYIRAGDRYADDDGDIASAVRCYTQAVKAAPSEFLRVDPDDNWLVMALKMDQIERNKEK